MNSYNTAKTCIHYDYKNGTCGNRVNTEIDSYLCPIHAKEHHDELLKQNSGNNHYLDGSVQNPVYIARKVK